MRQIHHRSGSGIASGVYSMDKDKTSSGSIEHKAGDGTKGGSSSGFDAKKARELYDMGMRDVELEKQLGVPRREVVEWRKRNGLAANRIMMWNEARARELYDAGATDKQIAADLSKAGGSVSAAAVMKWRRTNNLDANRPRGTWVRDNKALADNAPKTDKELPAAESPPETQTPDVQGGTRRGHLVALPSAPRNEEEPSETPPGFPKRGFHQRKRNKAEMPLPTVFARPMPGPDLFDDLDMMDFGEEPGGVPEQEAIYMFATILHLCRLDYGWDSEELSEFLGAVEFAEQLLYNIGAQTGTMDFDLDYDDGFDFDYVMSQQSKQKQKSKPKSKKTNNDKKKNTGGDKRKDNSGGPKNGGRGRSKNNNTTKK